MQSIKTARWTRGQLFCRVALGRVNQRSAATAENISKCCESIQAHSTLWGRDPAVAVIGSSLSTVPQWYCTMVNMHPMVCQHQTHIITNYLNIITSYFYRFCSYVFWRSVWTAYLRPKHTTVPFMLLPTAYFHRPNTVELITVWSSLSINFFRASHKNSFLQICI